jgi:hypothetical protein
MGLGCRTCQITVVQSNNRALLNNALSLPFSEQICLKLQLNAHNWQFSNNYYKEFYLQKSHETDNTANKGTSVIL